MGAGHPTEKVPHYTRSFPFPTRINKYVTGNPNSVSAWTIQCPFEEAGAWRWSSAKSKAVVLQDDFFKKDSTGRKIDFYTDFYWPFVRRWNDVVGNAGGRDKAKMVEVIPNEFCPVWPEDARPDKLVYAPHWYDLNTMFKKEFGNFTVNVQGLSRVCHDYCAELMIGDVPFERLILGEERTNKLQSTDQKYCPKRQGQDWRSPNHLWRMWSAHGHQVSLLIQYS